MAESRLIQGRYRLLDLIGRGGMGEVWRALDTALGRKVAVKCLKPAGARRDEQALAQVIQERFRREARVAASLQHRGITVVHDFGEDDGVLYLVMELLDGPNLLQLLEAGAHRPLPVPDLVDIATQTAAALGYTHDQGVVHRDLKPANIIRLSDGTVKICDFGIARLAHDIGFTAKMAGGAVAMGTPHYMSPEQIAGAGIDHRSDLYSLGCVLYELATGVPPFDLGDAWSVIVGHRDTPPAPPRDHRPDLPEYLERALLELLAKDPDDRPADAAEFGRRLAAEVPEQREQGAPVGVVPAGPAPAESGAQSGAGVQSGSHPGAQPPLPAWAAGMTTGSKALGGQSPPAPPDPASGLSRSWTTGRPTPSPELLASYAQRHEAGLALARLGRWEEAAVTHGALADERAAALGDDHPDTFASRHEYGFCLSRLGRPADALEAYESVARGRERVLGGDHADTLAARQETAYALGELGRHAEAHRVYLAVLDAWRRTAGPDHPDTLRCRHNLAYTLARLGRDQDALSEAEATAAARARVLGLGHADTLATRFEAGYAQGRLDRWDEALQTYREVASGRAVALGADHPDTLAARYEVCVSLGRLGRSAEALEQCRALVADRTRAAGAEDQETLRARHALGVALGRLGRWDDALAEAREVCALREKALGRDHPDTCVSRREIAVALGWQDRWTEALSVYQAVARARERALGPGHSETLASMGDEAHCLERLGRVAEAADVHRRVAERTHGGSSGLG